MSQTILFRAFKIWSFEIVSNFACLREAPPAKALFGGQALRRRQGFSASDLNVTV
jgi:hypothetical protein